MQLDTRTNHNHAPAEFPERGLMEFVARGVAVEFGQPPFTAVGRRRAVLATLMPMPEAAVNEDDGSVPRQNDVRPAGQFSAMQTKAKA